MEERHQDFRVMKMVTAKELKRRADSVLEEVFRSLFEEIDVEKIRREVDALRESAPGFDAADHARTLARRTAIRCAAAGAMTGIPSGLLAIGTLGADLAYLVFQQFRLIVGIAAIYGHEPSGRERFTEAFSCLAYSSGVGIGKQGIATMLESATIEGGIVAEKIGARFARERLMKIVPFVGAISGGALNYASVHAVARAAIRYYESRVDDAIAEEIWAEGDREHA
ncbi:MAG TPA: EcsC family protein [Thermoanaerobaculia bacterium]|nr:EcsC family protein [Thermoanaerobaculia bacterium]